VQEYAKFNFDLCSNAWEGKCSILYTEDFMYVRYVFVLSLEGKLYGLCVAISMEQSIMTGLI
jgi:hypothetical protein